MTVVQAYFNQFLFVSILTLLCKDLGLEIVNNLFHKTDLF